MKNISQVTTEISRLKYICDNVNTIVIYCPFMQISQVITAIVSKYHKS